MDAHAPLLLRFAALTHVGLLRSANQDCVAVGGRIIDPATDAPAISLYVDPPASCRLCLVADGMGGHPAGDVASRLAIELLLRELPAACHDDTALEDALRRVNAALFEQMRRVPALFGMGTTIAGIAITASETVCFNIGDTRVYRVAGGRLDQISQDHTVSMGVSVAGQPRPFRALTQCLGGYEGDESLAPFLVREPLRPGASYLVCSDGLHDMLTHAQMESCLRPDPVESVRRLFEGAMEAGGSDNISIVLSHLELPDQFQP